MPQHSDFRRIRRTGGRAVTGLVVLGSLLAGCAVRAPADTDFPKPLVDPLPLHIGVRFGEELTHYEHVEVIPGDREWIVTLGPANQAMFTRVFEAMFDETTVVETGGESERLAGTSAGDDMLAGGGSPEAPGVPLDAILEPSIESYEFANPLEWDEPYTTVWITYRMMLTTPDGRFIADFPIRAYGRSSYVMMGAEKSLVEATHMAMRDAGAYLALYFAKDPRIREWLRETGKLESPE